MKAVAQYRGLIISRWRDTERGGRPCETNDRLIELTLLLEDITPGPRAFVSLIHVTWVGGGIPGSILALNR